MAKSKKLPATLKDAVIAFLDDRPRVDVLLNLYERWKDEKEYEDFNEYQTVMEKLLGFPALTFKATKRPFGFHCTDCGEEFKVTVTVKGGKYNITAKTLTLKG